MANYDCFRKEIKYLPYTEYTDEHSFWDPLVWDPSSVLTDHEER